MATRAAILLVGPTGSGKTPLGDWLDRHGLAGRRCAHFDFGAQLRAAAEGNTATRFTTGETAFLRDLLDRGALLEDEEFPLAERLLDGFLAAQRVAATDLVILNGLPRHVGQATALERWVTVQRVVELHCDADTVLERLARDTGGDRAGRGDDAGALVDRKLAVYETRTRPLVEHYRARAAVIITIAVGAATTAADAARELAASL